MNRSEETIDRTPTSRRPCLAEGCPCKDARIVSRRKAAYFAARAQLKGQTADRVIAAEDGWRITATKPAETLG